MFETNEISWHGFPKINLPPDQRDLSRKSISIYLYTTTRPVEEIAPMHGTFYVQRPLPDRFCAGLTLTSQDVADLKELLQRRDMWIEQYQKAELDKNREIDGKNQDIRVMMANYDALTADAKAAQEHAGHQARVPLTGYSLQTKMLGGVHPDLWVGPRAEFEIRPLVRVNGLRLKGWRPDGSPHATLRMTVGQATAEAPVSAGLFTVDLRLPQDHSEDLRVVVECDAVPQIGADARELAFHLEELRTLHPMLPLVAAVLK
jgi:hypothetical protein